MKPRRKKISYKESFEHEVLYWSLLLEDYLLLNDNHLFDNKPWWISPVDDKEKEIGDDIEKLRFYRFAKIAATGMVAYADQDDPERRVFFKSIKDCAPLRLAVKNISISYEFNLATGEIKSTAKTLFGGWRDKKFDLVLEPSFFTHSHESDKNIDGMEVYVHLFSSEDETAKLDAKYTLYHNGPHPMPNIYRIVDQLKRTNATLTNKMIFNTLIEQAEIP